IDPPLALHLSIVLDDAGFAEEARRTFELAEPLDLFAASAPPEYDAQRQQTKTLTAWAQAAPHFRDLHSIIATIRQIKQEPEPYEQQDVQALTRSLQNQMLFSTGLALLDLQRWDDLSTLLREFDTNYRADLEWWFWLHVHCWKHCVASGEDAR